MTEEELIKYEQGRKLLDRVHKIEKQLTQLDKCDKVKIYYNNNNRNEDRIDFDFQKDNPFYEDSKMFIDKYKTFLRAEVEDLKDQFSKL